MARSVGYQAKIPLDSMQRRRGEKKIKKKHKSKKQETKSNRKDPWDLLEFVKEMMKLPSGRWNLPMDTNRKN